MLIDPKGIVRFQGLPQALFEEDLENLLRQYSAQAQENRTKEQSSLENQFDNGGGGSQEEGKL